MAQSFMRGAPWHWRRPVRKGRILIKARNAQQLLVAFLALSVRTYALEAPVSADPVQNYLLFCAGCHGLSGAGVPRRVPPLQASLPLLLRVDGGRDFLTRVPGVANSALNSAALATVLNWSVKQFAGSTIQAGTFVPFTAAELDAARDRPLLTIQGARREILERAGIATPALGETDY